jgi:hypothetical protein
VSAISRATPTLAVGISVVLVAAAGTFAAVRLATDGGGGYSDFFLVLGVFGFAGVARVVAMVVEVLRRGRSVAAMLSVSTATAAVLVVFGIAVGLRG